MADRRSASEAPPPLPTYRPELVEAGPDGRPAIAIVRDRPLAPDARAMADPVAMLPFDRLDHAVARMKWMATRRDRWTVWGRMAPILGAHTLAAFIDEEAAREAARMAEVRAETRAAKKRARTISAMCDEVHGRPVITLRKGDEAKPALTMRLSSAIERDRVWDWLRWQTHQYASWHVTCLQDGAVAVERLILDGMLREERRVRAAGLSAGGRRPLRFWRGQASEGGRDGQG